MATWTDPKTWNTGDALTAAELNTYVKNNTNALKLPPTAHHELNQTADLTVVSTVFVDVDTGADVGDEFTLALTTTGGDVMIGFVGGVRNSVGGSLVYLDVHESVANARIAGDDGMLVVEAPNASDVVNASFVWLATGLAAGLHTFKLQWKVNANTGTMFAGAGTVAVDVHPQFWVREVS